MLQFKLKQEMIFECVYILNEYTFNKQELISFSGRMSNYNAKKAIAYY